MGIRVVCPNGHKLNVKSFLAGKKGICPHCGSRFEIPAPANDAVGNAPPPEPIGGEAELDLGELVSGATHLTPRSPDATPSPDASPAHAAAAHSNAAPHPSADYVASHAAPGTMQPVNPQAFAAGTQAYVDPSAVQAAPVTASPGYVAATAQLTQVAPDPFVEAPGANWYLRPISGGQFGPAQADIMRQWLAEGRVSGDALIWREGWTDWLKADTVFTHLAPVVEPAAVAAPTAADPQPFVTGFDEAMSRPSSSPRPDGHARTARRPRKKAPSQTVIISTILAICIFLLAIVFAAIYFSQMADSKKKSQLPYLPPVVARQAFGWSKSSRL